MVVSICHLITFELDSRVKWVTPNLLNPKAWGKTHHGSLSMSVCLSFYSRFVGNLCASPNFAMVLLLQNFYWNFSFKIFSTKNKWSNLIMILKLTCWSGEVPTTFIPTRPSFNLLEFWAGILKITSLVLECKPCLSRTLRRPLLGIKHQESTMNLMQH